MFKVKRMTLCFDWYRSLQDNGLKYNLVLYDTFVQNVIVVTWSTKCYLGLYRIKDLCAIDILAHFPVSFNSLNPNIHIPIPQTDHYTFP